MNRAVKILLWVVAIAVAVVVLFLWVFPWVERMQQDPTMGAPAAAEPWGAPMGFHQVARSPR